MGESDVTPRDRVRGDIKGQGGEELQHLGQLGRFGVYGWSDPGRRSACHGLFGGLSKGEIKMIHKQSPGRIAWEDALYLAIEESGLCRSDAQSIVEVKSRMVDELYEQRIAPEIAARTLAE